MRVMYCCLAALLPALASARVYDLERDFGAVPDGRVVDAATGQVGGTDNSVQLQKAWMEMQSSRMHLTQTIRRPH